MNKLTINKVKLTAIISLAVSFLCCLIISFTGFFAAPADASAVGAQFNFEASANKATRLTSLQGLFAKINGGTAANNYATFSSALGDNVKDSRQINSYIKINGNNWQVVYASRADYNYGATSKGDVIATVYLASDIVANNQNQQMFSTWLSEDTSRSYPSNMYSSSFARSQLNGTHYVASENAGALSAGDQAAVWKSVQDAYGKFMAVPANMGWQEKLSAVTHITNETNAANDAWGTPDNGAPSPDYSKKSRYTDWKYDKLWLPAQAEVGCGNFNGAERNGLWNTTAAMRKHSTANGCWLRTADARGSRVRCVGTTGEFILGDTQVNIARAIRPAFHLNLRLLYEYLTTESEELFEFDSSAPSASALTALLSALNADNDNTYAELRKAVNENGGYLDAEQIRANNGGKDIVVYLRGRQWYVPFVSKDKSGNIIATLWLKDGGMGDLVPYAAGWYSDDHTLSYPGHMYSTSYVRSYLNGTPFVTTEGAVAGETNINVTSSSNLYIDYNGAQSEMWKNFLSGSITDYLVQPKNIDWQNDGTVAFDALGWSKSRQCPNSFVNNNKIPFAGNHNYTDRGAGVTAYSAWGDDFLYLPSFYEVGLVTGSVPYSGLWNAPLSMRTNDTGSSASKVHGEPAEGEVSPVSDMNSYWSRLGSSWDTAGVGFSSAARAYMWEASSSGIGNNLHVFHNLSLRPAINFNITKAVGGEESELDLAQLWNEAVQKSLDTGKQVEFILPENWYAQHSNTINANSFGEGVGFDTGRIYVPAGANIKLRLNGHSIDRNLTSFIDKGNVIFIDGGTLEIVDQTVSHGGKITGGYTNAGIDVDGSRVNTGGGILVLNGGRLVLSGGTVTGNYSRETAKDDASAMFGGGGVTVDGEGSTFIMNGGEISGNGGIIDGGKYLMGGGVYLTRGASFVMNGGDIVRNEATLGGGVGAIDHVKLEINGGNISYNASSQFAGGIYLNSECEAVINNAVIKNNQSLNYGGGIMVNGGSVLVINGGSVSYNTTQTNGGGIHVFNSSALEINGGEISDNYAEGDGGGVALEAVQKESGGSALKINGGKICRNSGDRCGGLFVWGDETGKDMSLAVIDLLGGEISYNTARNPSGWGGGAGLFGYCTINLDGCNVINNLSNFAAGGLHVVYDSVFNMYSGNISGNESLASSDWGGGGILVSGSSEAFEKTVFNMYGGKISGNKSNCSGGGAYFGGATVNLYGGEISGNTAEYAGGGIYIRYSAMHIANAKINDNKALSIGSAGGGIYSQSTNIIMDGGEINGNRNYSTGRNGGAGIMFNTTTGKSKVTFVMNGGEICYNESTWAGGGIFIGYNSEFILNDGLMAYNKDGGGFYGGGAVFAQTENAMFTMNGGLITKNESSGQGGGVYIQVQAIMNMNGGRIVENVAPLHGGGISVANAAVLHLSGGIVARNTKPNGSADNVYLQTIENRIDITGTLRGDGETSYIGVNLGFSGQFTVNYKTHNPVYSPLTYFFSDDTTYGVIYVGNEAHLSSSVNRETLLWEYSSDGGSTWKKIETTQITVNYTGSNYRVRAMYNGSVIISKPTSTSIEGDDETNLPEAFSAVGSYAYTLANATSGGVTFANPTLIFEIVRSELVWQYRVQGGEWQDISNNELMFTGSVYEIRALNGDTPVALADDIKMRSAGSYEFEVADNASGNYENGSLTFTIISRTITFNWNFPGWSGDLYNGFKIKYDGLEHYPVFTVDGIDNEIIGQLKIRADYFYNGSQIYVNPKNAGVYDAKVVFADDSSFKDDLGVNIFFLNHNIRFNITPIELSVAWRNETDMPIEEAEYVYNGEERSVGVRLLGLRKGDNGITPVLNYYLNGSPMANAPENVGKYLARVSLPESCVNYILDDNYACQINISKMVISPQFAGNENNSGLFVWTYNGKVQAPSVTILGAKGELPASEYTVTGNDKINAGTYTVSVALGAEAAKNYVLEAFTKSYTIAKAGVNIIWNGTTDGSTDAADNISDGVIVWTYDKLLHSVTAQAVPENTDLAPFALNLSGVDGLTDVGAKTATATLNLTDAQNYVLLASAPLSQKYRVDKFIITSVTWKRGDVTNSSHDRPHYSHGTITGAGPAYAVSAQGVDSETLSFNVTYSFAGTAEGVAWPEDNVNGYKAFAALSADQFKNYAFAENISSDGGKTAFIVFYIDPISGEKTSVTPVWVIFTKESVGVGSGSDSYQTLTQFIQANGGDRFVFEYSFGVKRNIYAVWLNDDGTIKEILNTVTTGEGTNAGDYVSRLLPSVEYDYSGKLECSFRIIPKKLTVQWTAGALTYDGTEKVPESKVYYNGVLLTADELAEAGFSAHGAYNAGPHIAIASVNGNYEITGGGDRFEFTITPKPFSAADIVWENTVLAENGSEQAPTAKFKIKTDAPDEQADAWITLRVLGAAKGAGTYTAYAVLDSTNLTHSNYVISDPDNATKVFKIVLVRIDVNNVYWKITEGGATVSQSSPAEYVYTIGAEQGPVAYYTDSEGNEIALAVVGKMTDAGKYVASVAAGYDFVNGSVSVSAPTCAFEIKAKQITVQWDAGSLKVTYSGVERKPVFSFGGDLTDADRTALNGLYTLTGFTDAGKYTAQIKLVSNNAGSNYLFETNGVDGSTILTDTLETAFEIEKISLTENVNFTWDTVVSWVYDGAEHAPALNQLAYNLGSGTVTFTLSYTGKTANAGVHYVTPVLVSAIWDVDGGQKDITSNFALNIGAKEYTITAKTVTVEWDWDGSALNGSVHEWKYNGTERGPAAYMTDSNGDRIQNENGDWALEVYDKGVNVGEYTARVFAPDNYVFTGNVFTVEADYKIAKADVTIEWDDNGGTDENGVTVWIYDGAEHFPKAYIVVDGVRGGEVKVTGSATDAGEFTARAEEESSNYTIVGGNVTRTCKITAAEVYLIWQGYNNTQSFDWQYAGGSYVGPTAVLATKNTDGDIVAIVKDGGYISVTVTGAMSQVCADGENYVATAVDNFVNYDFAADAEITKDFRIVPKELSGSGYQFKWNSGSVIPVLGGDFPVYNYVYNGEAQSPSPETEEAFDRVFVTLFYKVESDGTLTLVPENAVTDAGKYRLVTASADGNYIVPAGMETIEVVIAAMEVEVVWNIDGLVYKGANVEQVPEAHYLDVNGNKVTLNVLVDGAHANAGEYEASASFTAQVTNYTLKASTVKQKYKIAAREIPVTWDWTGWTAKGVTYDGKAHLPVVLPYLEFADSDDVQNGGLTVNRTLTFNGNAVTEAVNAGVYKLTVTLSGSSAGNYKLTNAEDSFTIAKRSLTITAESATVAYGSPAPAYSAVFSGFADGEDENTFNLLDAAVKSNWLTCSYNKRSQPGTYAIRLNKIWLENTLKNYRLTLGDGTLTVTAAERMVIWRGELEDLGAYYDGVEYKPTAIYYKNGTTGTPTQLTVVYATYDSATGTYTPLNDNDFRAIDAGTYYVMALDESGTATLTNSCISYEIYKREVVVNINSVKGQVFGDVFKTTGENGENITHKFLSWSFGDVKPVLGHDLKISLSVEFGFDSHGYANAGEYNITGSWDEDNFSANYKVTFSGEAEDQDGANTMGVYEIQLAKISILKRDDIMSEGDFQFHVGNVGGGKAWYIRLGDYSEVDGVEQYTFIGSNGYRGRDEVHVYYSRGAYDLLAPDGTVNIPAPEDETDWVTERVGLRVVGKYAINFKIEIANHETLYGTWRVIILPENQIVRVIFTKPYETEYGKPVPENLAQYLYREGYITFDNIGIDSFNSRVTATVDDGFGGTVDSKTGVGKYTVNFAIDNTGSDIEYTIVYNTLQSLEETNVNAYVIKPKRIYVEWGEKEYEYNGQLNAPSVNLSGWITANDRIITPDQLRFVSEGDGYEYAAFKVFDNGADVSVVITTRGNFTAVGGHMMRVTVEDKNYTVKAGEDEAVISIVNGSDPDPVITEGLPQWLLWALIAAGALLLILLIIIFVLASKRNKAGVTVFGGYDEGFGDDTEEYPDESNDEE